MSTRSLKLTRKRVTFTKGPRLPMVYRMGYALRATLFFPLVLRSWRLLIGRDQYFSPTLARWLADIVNASGGRWHDYLGKIVVWCRRTSKNAGETLSQELIAVSTEVRDKGFMRIPGLIPSEYARMLKEVAKKCPGRDASGNVYTNFERWNDLSASSKFIVQLPKGDPLLEQIAPYLEKLRMIASVILSTEPLLLNSQIWFNRPPKSFGKGLDDLDQSAMRFHCDADAPGFIKVFLLLEDVLDENGPLTFAIGSHKTCRHVAWREPDELINRHFPMLGLGTGRAGDAVVADTRGWHKAGVPSNGVRVVMQLVFVSSYFGCPEN